MSILELDLYNCYLDEVCGSTISKSLEQNFCIEKFSIGNNRILEKDIEKIQLSVLFNTQYNQQKNSQVNFVGYAHNIIAESLKKWALSSKFVTNKLYQRLRVPVDELDSQIAGVLFDKNGRLDLKPVPQYHEYVSGDGDIRFPKKRF